MDIKHLGEFGLIDRLTKGIKTDRSVIAGIGEDAAVLRYTKKEHLLVTCDMLIEDVDFRINYAAPEDIGWKAVCCSVSDIAAMGGEPKWLVVSIGIPRRMELSAIDSIYKGMRRAAGRFGVNIVGGDTSRSEKLVIDVAMLGLVKKENLKLRSGARPGDVIFVTGALGGAVRLGKHLNFTPRIKESQALVKNFKISAMIDISDGLSSDLAHILTASSAGAVIYERLLPKTEGVSTKDALCEGEDFELLFTVPKKEAGRLKKEFPRFCRAVRLTEIGRIAAKEKGFTLISPSGRASPVRPEGHNHFAAAKTQHMNKGYVSKNAEVGIKRPERDY